MGMKNFCKPLQNNKIYFSKNADSKTCNTLCSNKYLKNRNK